MTASTTAIVQNEPALLVVGALHVDEVATINGEVVACASNPVSWQRSVGGVASNAARAAYAHFSRTGKGSVILHAALGNDASGRMLHDCLLDAGLRVSAHTFKSTVTGRYSAIMSDDGELIIGLADVALAEQLPPEFAESAMRNDDVAAILLDANLSGACIDSLVRTANQTSTQLAAMAVSPTKALRLLPNATGIDLLLCNRLEAFALAQAAKLIKTRDAASCVPIQSLGDALKQIGFGQFVVTDGDSDLLICAEDEYKLLPIRPVQDAQVNKGKGNVNGAGDALAGASMAAICQGSSLVNAVAEHGLKMSASVISGEHLPLTLTPETESP